MCREKQKVVKFTVRLWKILLGCLIRLKESRVSTTETDKVLKMLSDRLAKEHSKGVLSSGLMWILLALIKILLMKG